MKKIYFLNNLQEQKEIGSCSNEEMAWEIIYTFLKEHNYKAAYVREWDEGSRHWYDVGSHSEFFFTEEA